MHNKKVALKLLRQHMEDGEVFEVALEKVGITASDISYWRKKYPKLDGWISALQDYSRRKRLGKLRSKLYELGLAGDQRAIDSYLNRYDDTPISSLQGVDVQSMIISLLRRNQIPEPEKPKLIEAQGREKTEGGEEGVDGQKPDGKPSKKIDIYLQS